MKRQICGQLCFEQKSKIWCKNINAFLRNYDFRVGAFYFDAPCKYIKFMLLLLLYKTKNTTEKNILHGASYDVFFKFEKFGLRFLKAGSAETVHFYPQREQLQLSADSAT